VPATPHDTPRLDPHDRYGGDVLAGDWKARGRRVIPTVEAERDLVVELAENGFCGAIVGVEKGTVTLEDRFGAKRMFPLGHGFLVDGTAVQLVAPKPKAPTGRLRTASGSFAVASAPARVALPSRVFVEGRHDAELVEKVWGDDLRIEGVVVEMLDGVDDLAGAIRDFQPGPGRRMGVLVDHLLPGTKEDKVVQACRKGPYAAHVRILGHPYVDVWQSVRPERLGLEQWPVIPRGRSWKHGICHHLGWQADSQADIARAWKQILGTVRSYADLEPTLLASVEELIDFVTEPGH
jgi:hypothetical protein